MQVQLALMYGTDKERLRIVMPIIIQQRNIVDCGVFAITKAVEFCFTNFEGIEGNRTDCVFDHDKVRSHLLTCVVKENLGSLPKRPDTRPVCFEFHNVTVSRFCKCGLPDTLENVVTGM